MLIVINVIMLLRFKISTEDGVTIESGEVPRDKAQTCTRESEISGRSV